VRKPELVSRDVVYRGKLITVHRDTLRNTDGNTTEREVADHPDSVAVVLLDADERVLMVRQYRHPVDDFLVELPAGLCDKPGESPVEAARRELAEETGTTAGWWRTLVDLYPSPGMTGERVRVFLAREPTPVTDGPTPDPDEALDPTWLPLTEAVHRVFNGEITNGLAVAGLLAAAHAQRPGHERLREPNS
jgi:8-oxo-dGTP pyrophosphatase MutT (NUDIX family)